MAGLGSWMRRGCVLGAIAVAMLFGANGAALAGPQPDAHDFLIKDFHFRSGGTLPTLRVRYYTLGAPHRDAAGKIDNAVLVLHGTGGSGRNFTASPQFADVLLIPGGLLDPAKYFVIMPDGIGHGASSKPSDGMHMRFPKYDYADMVEAQHLLVTKALGIQKLRLVMGASMGCMHSFMWAEAWPDAVQAVMPLACQAQELAGRNRLWRKMAVDAIEADPLWQGGEYTTPPVQGLRTAEDLLILVGQSPLPMQLAMPRGAAVDAYVATELPKRLATIEANDTIYQLEASRTYDPSKGLESITAPLTWVNSGDDFINPPELGMAQRDVQRIKGGRFVLIPASKDTHGHGTHTWAALWKDELAALLTRSGG